MDRLDETGHNDMMTKMVSMAAAKASFSEFASRAAAGERFTLVRRGKPVAGLVSPKDLATLESRQQVDDLMDALAKFRRRNRGKLPTDAVTVQRSRGRKVP